MKSKDYSMYFDFIKKYEAQGFQNIDRNDSFINQLEEKLKQSNQFFHVHDCLKFDLFYVSNGIKNFIGIEPHEFDFSVMFTKLHPDDLERYNLARAKYFKTAQDLLIQGGGIRIISSNFRLNNNIKFTNVLFQGFLFYSNINVKTVYALLSFTDISHLDKGKHTYHYYLGEEKENFRYPDDKLLKLGRLFSPREYDILKLIALGLDSSEIADKLFLSVNTVNTHRRNLLKKTNKSTCHELVIEMKEGGIL